MTFTYQERTELAESLRIALGGKYDGSKKNIVVPECPFCGKTGYKFGVYVGEEQRNKIPFMWNCFSCGKRGKYLKPLLEQIDRMDLNPDITTDISKPIELDGEFAIKEEDDTIELSLVELPQSYKRKFSIKYLKDRGFTMKDMNYFEVGQTSDMNYDFADYVIFPVVEDGDYVGYVSRHTWSKDKIDNYNAINKRKKLRYKNSKEEDGNDFKHLLYNIDAVIEGKTRTVILVEGIIDCIALVRKLNLYEAEDIAVCATFGKQVSPTKMVKLQLKGVDTIVLGYDGGTVNFTREASDTLSEYFEVLIADIDGVDRDWDDLTQMEVEDIFMDGLLSPVEYGLKRI